MWAGWRETRTNKRAGTLLKSVPKADAAAGAYEYDERDEGCLSERGGGGGVCSAGSISSRAATVVRLHRSDGVCECLELGSECSQLALQQRFARRGRASRRGG